MQWEIRDGDVLGGGGARARRFALRWPHWNRRSNWIEGEIVGKKRRQREQEGQSERETRKQISIRVIAILNGILPLDSKGEWDP